ncbi:MAG: 23S rRNA (guanosine(2251)-2'-O)-methyltransferase RlmB [Sutterellaceae bacterium]|nr:23S rRNA (guanosine(2251)-2'-O)-methyltransferase RlmB [Sutterellaceae bacterium]MDD7441935.1 23S rRNA (guanosine(2251)-2'-O)-methyltransferase RlmB [Sutterellaceae bacterium]MDY2867771.1 23S rRNA (guanosine(2251)-2'-O)-methyltransferase RlmB [Mesosutterella sp.]
MKGKQQKTVLAGFHAVTARLNLNPKTIDEVYVDRSRHDRRMHEMCEKLRAVGIRPIGADPDRLARLAGDVPHQGIVAVGSALERTMSFDELLDSITEKTLLLILDGVTDPRNFGACLRVADAAGVQAVIAPLNRSSHVTPAAAKAAAGAEESVPVIYVVNLASAIAELRDAGVMVVGTAGETDRSIYDFDQKRAFAWVLGAEGDGLRQLTRKRCDALAAIPMMGSVESLNVSVAAGVCLFESVRQRVGSAERKVDNPSRAKF